MSVVVDRRPDTDADGDAPLAAPLDLWGDARPLPAWVQAVAYDLDVDALVDVIIARCLGIAFPSQASDETTVSLSQGSNVVAKAKTDDNGYFEFTKVAPGTYTLSRTSTSSNCPTTTTSGQQPTCTMASSMAMGPEITLSPGGEVRADVF